MYAHARVVLLIFFPCPLKKSAGFGKSSILKLRDPVSGGAANFWQQKV